IQELATMAENNLNVTVIVLENGALGMVRQQQEYLFDKHYSASTFASNPDLLKIAEGFGIRSVDADADPDWQKKAFGVKGPVFVRTKIARCENVLPFVKGGSLNIDSLR
ncbi:MAG: acetolactate synthase large subunit, partial [Treponema sp.]|nr:acetolactate synthase large subunit [Treponema sp.]